MKVNQILISILVGISVGAQPIIGFNYGAKNYLRVKKALDIAMTPRRSCPSSHFCSSSSRR